MADISSYIRLIELAARGEEVRDAIINALTSMNREAYGEFDDEPTAGSGKAVTSDAIKTALDGKQDILTFDNTPTLNSNNPVKAVSTAPYRRCRERCSSTRNQLRIARTRSHQAVFTTPCRMWKSLWMRHQRRTATTR